ncbi:MAG: DNA cytosine methyltransferase, partial [Candidatus Woesearchaeota archaeon]
MKYRTIDLFCGAGGFSKGFELTKKFHILKGYDNNDVALKTFSKNHQGEGINYDIREAVPNELKNNVDVVIGSPPCQGFSDAKGSRSLEDERNDLVFHFIRWVNEIKPKVFVMENVAGLLTIDDNFVKEVERRYDESGYYIDYNIYNSKDFGVPQKRKRAIFVGINKEFFGNN